MVANAIKHDRIDEAAQAARAADERLAGLRSDLADLGASEPTAPVLEISAGFRFADIFSRTRSAPSPNSWARWTPNGSSFSRSDAVVRRCGERPMGRRDRGVPQPIRSARDTMIPSGPRT
jgi:hypothetical protein